MFCEGKDTSGMIRHDDQNRGAAYAYLEGIGPGGSHYNYVSPDFFRLVPWQGDGLKPIGYGYDSIEAIVESALAVEAAGIAAGEPRALAARQAAAHRRGGHHRHAGQQRHKRAGGGSRPHVDPGRRKGVDHQLRPDRGEREAAGMRRK
jgi:hypothetical protein